MYAALKATSVWGLNLQQRIKVACDEVYGIGAIREEAAYYQRTYEQALCNLLLRRHFHPIRLLIPCQALSY